MKFRVVLEVPPARRLREVERVASLLANVLHLVYALEVPESTFGKPTASSVLYGITLRRLLGDVRIIANLRLIDHNKVGLLGIVMGGVMAGVNKFLLVRGDPPVDSTPVSELDPCSAVRLIKGQLGDEVELGLAVSKYEEDYIRWKLSCRPDFVMSQYTDDEKDLEMLRSLAEEYGVVAYPPVVVHTHRNHNIVVRVVGRELRVPENPIGNAVEKAVSLGLKFGGFYISAPGDFESSINVVEELSKVS